MLTQCVNPCPSLYLLQQANPERYPYLLESVAIGDHQRYDILFAFPGKTLQLDCSGQLIHGNETIANPDFLAYFDQWWQQHKSTATDDSDLPFTGGWFVFLAYELAQQIESIHMPRSHSSLPIAFATRIVAAIIMDHQKTCGWLVVEPEYAHLLTKLNDDISNLTNALKNTAHPPFLQNDLVEDAPEDYTQAVAKIKNYIVEGDVFQVNLSRLWRGEMQSGITPANIYQQLRLANPAPFSGMVYYQNCAIASSSPERLIRVQGAKVDTRPIAGTRPRSATQMIDMDYSRELLAHPKERAEHIMLIDLERNDLGRICQPGSIHVDEIMRLESYSHVHHIVSNISGLLNRGTSPGEIIRAVFPGGTITGCPKVRCMEIIAELEKTGRGAYTGSMGYINRNGDMDLNILIRTLEIANRNIWFRAGAGIVADSIAEKELDETRAKAEGLIRALN